MKNPDKIRSYFKKEWLLVLGVVLTGTVFNVFTVYIPIKQGVLIDALVAGDLTSILWASIFFLAVIFGVQTARFLKRLFVRKFANKINQTMRTLCYRHVIREDFLTLNKESSGDLMTRIIGDVDITVEGIRKVTTETFDTGVLMISYFVTLMIFDVPLTLLASLFIPMAMLLSESLKKWVYRTSKDSRNQMSKMASSTIEMAKHGILFRTHGALSYKIEKYDQDLLALEKKSVKANILENALVPLYLMIASFGAIFILYFGGQKVIAGTWSLGTFLAYFGLYIALAVKASKSAKLVNSAQKASVSWRRVNPFLTEELPESGQEGLIPTNANLSISDLTFSFPDNGKEVFKHVSLEAKPGQIIGVTGPIASGKSSFGIALTGLYPYEGSIRYGEKEIRDLSQHERSELIAYLGHDPSLLSDSIEANIGLGTPVDLTSIFERIAFQQDLNQMPDKEKTLVGNGGIRLSGGQQARIGLARALAKHRPIIILDDPFSAVDTLTETAIMDQLRHHYRESIIFIISHRLSIFPRCDQVLLFGERPLVGNHGDLLVKSDVYRSIFELQGGNGYGH